MMKNLIHNDSKKSPHLLIPVFSYIKPTTGYQFIHHVLLSMGCFSTEVDLILHQNLREAFRYAKLISPSKDPDNLQMYSNQLLYRWITEKLQFTTPSFRGQYEFITITAEIFNSIIVYNELPILDMPPVQLSTLFRNSNEDINLYVKTLKLIFFEAIYKELGQNTFDAYNVPSKEDILNATKSLPLDWNGADSFVCNEQVKSNNSFIE